MQAVRDGTASVDFYSLSTALIASRSLKHAASNCRRGYHGPSTTTLLYYLTEGKIESSLQKLRETGNDRFPTHNRPDDKYVNCVLLSTAIVSFLSVTIWAANCIAACASIVSGQLWVASNCSRDRDGLSAYPAGRARRRSVSDICQEHLNAAGLGFGLTAVAAYFVAVPP